MIVWTAKDPAEVLDFTWTVPLDAGDTIASHTASESSGTVVIDSDDHSGTQVAVWLSGGADGETATIALTATTTGGRKFREVAVLPVFDRASELLALFRLRYAGLVSVSDGMVSYWLADAVANVGDGWAETGRDPARLALAAHMLEASGARTNAIPAGVTSFKSGTFSATMSDSVAARTGFSATAYGREYLDLVRRHFAGPITAWTPPAAYP